MSEEEIVNKLINTYEKMCEKYTFDSLFRIRQDEMKLILGLITNLQQENQSLKDKIEKAIEYTKDKTNVIPLEQGGGLELCDYDIANLLEILERGTYEKNIKK